MRAQVGLPCLKSRLDDLYEDMFPADPLGLSLAACTDSSPSAPSILPAWDAIKATSRRWFKLAYPVVRTAGGLSSWVYLVLYLHQLTDFPSPTMHLSGLQLARVLPAEMVLIARVLRPDSMRYSASAMACGHRDEARRCSRWPANPWCGGCGGCFGRRGTAPPTPSPWRPSSSASCSGGTPRHRRGATARSASPHLHRVLRCVSSISQLTLGQTVATLPSDPAICPLCRRVRTNSAAIPTGFLFCYPCVHQHRAQVAAVSSDTDAGVAERHPARV